MKNIIVEFLAMFLSSIKMQIIFIFGIVLFLLINFIGDYTIANFEFKGALKGLEDHIIAGLARKYDKLALLTLVSSFALMSRVYKKEQNRMW